MQCQSVLILKDLKCCLNCNKVQTTISFYSAKLKAQQSKNQRAMSLIANTSQKQHQFKEQQFLTATLKIMVCLKAHTNKLFQFDRVTFSAAPLTQPCGKLTKSLGT